MTNPGAKDLESIEWYHRLSVTYVRERLRVRINRARLYIGSHIIGGDLFFIYAALWLIRDRALAAVHADGSVILSECGPLADALYEELPGQWTITITRINPPAELTHD